MDREIRAEGHRLIHAPLHRVWQVLSRLESHPRYTNLWLTADLLERSQASAVVEFRGFFGGLPITSVQRMALRPPGRIEFRQVRGTLRALSGAYVLSDAGGETDLEARIAVDPGIVFFSEPSVRQILVAHIDGTLAKVKASAERDLVRVPPRRTASAAEDGRSGRVSAATVEPADAPAEAVSDDEVPSDVEVPGPLADRAAGKADEAGATPSTGAAGAQKHPPAGGRRRRRRRRGGAPRPPASG
jgi:hypothetical protein